MSDAALQHDALIYSSDEEFCTNVVPFLRDGLASGDAVVAVTTAGNIGLLRDSLGADASDIAFVDAVEWYVRPARTIAGYHRVLHEHLDAGARRVRVIGEVEFGRTRREHTEWTRYESVLNEAFASSPAWIVCPYDSRTLPGPIVEDARRTHPFVFERGRRVPSGHYVDPRRLVEDRSPPIDDDPARILVELPMSDDLGNAREIVTAHARGMGLSADRVDMFVIALNEILTNALLYGGGIRRLVLGTDGRSFLCEVTDRGTGIDDPLAGFVPPDPTRDGGFGLWMARQFCDSVELRTTSEGLTVRLAVDLERS